jgi:hypothetical protein
VGQTLEVVAGSDRSWGTTLRSAEGVALTFGPADALDASVGRGGGEGTLFAPAVAWVDAPAGAVRLSVSAAQTAAVDPGEYRLLIGVTAGGARSIAFDGILRVDSGVGIDAAPMVWCTLQDMFRHSSQLRTIHAEASRRAPTDFLDERGFATAEVRRKILLRYDPQSGLPRVRRTTPDPILGFDVPDRAAAVPTPAEISASLAVAGGLVLEPTIREIVARRAVADVLERQSSSSRDARDDARMHRDEADRLFKCYWAQVDTDLDGTADLLVHRNVILLPPGTAP